MSRIENRPLKDLPPNINMSPKIYADNNISILKPDRFILNVECCFENYHFAVPTVQPPPIKMGKKQYMFKANRILAINPEQSLLVTQDVPAKEYTALFIRKNFMQEIAYCICGKRDVQFINDSYFTSKRLTDSFENFIYESASIQPNCTLMLDSIGTQIAIQLLRETNNNILAKIMDRTYTDKSPVDKAVEFIEMHYNSDISLNDLCTVSNLSPYHFIRIFKSGTGRTPHEYLMDKKISKALELIKLNKHSLNEVAQLCGFVSQSHFSTAFKRKMGVSPLVYKKEL